MGIPPTHAVGRVASFQHTTNRQLSLSWCPTLRRTRAWAAVSRLGAPAT